MRFSKLLSVAVTGYLCVVISPQGNAMSWASVSEFFETLSSESGAWAVQVKQTALSANQASQSQVTSNQQLATALGAISMSDRVSTAVTSFHSDVGQPVTIKCLAQQNNTLFVESDSQRNRDTSRLMQSYASQRVGSASEADAEILALHRDTYCTVSESKQGMCNLTPNGMQGWDVNYSGAFSEKTLAPEGEVAAYAYVAMISDSRAEALTDCGSTACEAAQSNQLAMSAMNAMVANSIVGQVTDRRMPMLTGN